MVVRYTVPPPSTHSLRRLPHGRHLHLLQNTPVRPSQRTRDHHKELEREKAVKHERHKAQGLTDLYLTAVPSERSTAVTCGQYSSRYVSAAGCEEEETTTRRPKKRKKKKHTNCQKLPHRIATARQPSMREEIKFSSPLVPASPLAPLLPARLPTCLLAFQIRDAISLNSSVCS